MKTYHFPTIEQLILVKLNSDTGLVKDSIIITCGTCGELTNFKAMPDPLNANYLYFIFKAALLTNFNGRLYIARINFVTNTIDWVNHSLSPVGSNIYVSDVASHNYLYFYKINDFVGRMSKDDQTDQATIDFTGSSKDSILKVSPSGIPTLGFVKEFSGDAHLCLVSLKQSDMAYDKSYCVFGGSDCQGINDLSFDQSSGDIYFVHKENSSSSVNGLGKADSNLVIGLLVNISPSQYYTNRNIFFISNTLYFVTSTLDQNSILMMKMSPEDFTPTPDSCSKTQSVINVPITSTKIDEPLSNTHDPDPIPIPFTASSLKVAKIIIYNRLFDEPQDVMLESPALGGCELPPLQVLDDSDLTINLIQGEESELDISGFFTHCQNQIELLLVKSSDNSEPIVDAHLVQKKKVIRFYFNLKDEEVYTIEYLLKAKRPQDGTWAHSKKIIIKASRQKSDDCGTSGKVFPLVFQEQTASVDNQGIRIQRMYFDEENEEILASGNQSLSDVIKYSIFDINFVNLGSISIPFQANSYINSREGQMKNRVVIGLFYAKTNANSYHNLILLNYDFKTQTKNYMTRLDTSKNFQPVDMHTDWVNGFVYIFKDMKGSQLASSSSTMLETKIIKMNLATGALVKAISIDFTGYHHQFCDFDYSEAREIFYVATFAKGFNPGIFKILPTDLSIESHLFFEGEGTKYLVGILELEEALIITYSIELSNKNHCLVSLDPDNLVSNFGIKTNVDDNQGYQRRQTRMLQLTKDRFAIFFHGDSFSFSLIVIYSDDLKLIKNLGHMVGIQTSHEIPRFKMKNQIAYSQVNSSGKSEVHLIPYDFSDSYKYCNQLDKFTSASISQTDFQEYIKERSDVVNLADISSQCTLYDESDNFSIHYHGEKWILGEYQTTFNSCDGNMNPVRKDAADFPATFQDSVSHTIGDPAFTFKISDEKNYYYNCLSYETEIFQAQIDGGALPSYASFNALKLTIDPPAEGGILGTSKVEIKARNKDIPTLLADESIEFDFIKQAVPDLLTHDFTAERGTVFEFQAIEVLNDLTDGTYILTVTGIPAWITYDSLSISVTTPIDSSYLGNTYSVDVKINDGVNLTVENTDSFTISIIENDPITSGIIGQINIAAGSKTPYEIPALKGIGDSDIITWGFTPDYDWITFDPESGEIIFDDIQIWMKGQTYQFDLWISDQVNPKYDTNLSAFVVGNTSPQALTIPEDYLGFIPLTHSFDVSSSCMDPETTPLTYTFTLKNEAGVEVTNPSITFINDVIELDYPNQQNIGKFTAQVKCFDGQFSDEFSFEIRVVSESPPLVYNPLVVFYAVIGAPFSVYLPSDYFIDPEGRPIVIETDYTLPDFMNYDQELLWIHGYTGSSSNEASFEIKLYASDEFFTTTHSFYIQLNICFFRCSSCFGEQMDECLTCFDDFFYYNYFCWEQCPDGSTLEFPTDKICQECHSSCATCDGLLESDCLSCSFGFYKYQTTCLEDCPDGFFKDDSTQECTRCDPLCPTCFGPSTNECFTCDISQGVILSQTDCIEPRCLDGLYFDWDLLDCKACHHSCSSCSRFGEFSCHECAKGRVRDVFTCVPCEAFPGLFTNEEYQCEEICGDKYLYPNSIHECDDDNTIPNDGCSDCKLDYGYSCWNTTCKEVIPPTFEIVDVTQNNNLTITFSEGVVIPESVEQTIINNLLIEIPGFFNYTKNFTFGQLERNSEKDYIKVFYISLEDFQQSIEGDEVITLIFKNATIIEDLAGNPMVQEYAQNKLKTFVFVSETEAASISASSDTTKTSTIVLIILNIGLNVFLSASMNYMWDLVHILQVFRYLALLNVDFPWNIHIFAEAMKFASGDFQELKVLLPSLPDLGIDFSELEEFINIFPENFKNGGIETVYLIRLYAGTIAACIFIVFIAWPFTLFFVQSKRCGKKFLVQKLYHSLFYTSLLRALIEMYIDLMFSCFLNSVNLGLETVPHTIASTFAFLVTCIAYIIPFVFMFYLQKQYRFLNRAQFKNHFGTISEEIEIDKKALKYYYVPLFMCQRLSLAGIIVYLYEVPLVQIGLVILLNSLMITYLSVVKPFKTKRQKRSILFDEFVLMFAVSSFIIFSVFELKVDSKVLIGWLIVALISISIAKNLSIAFFYTTKSIHQKIRKIRGNRQIQNMPSDSQSNENEQIDNQSSENQSSENQSSENQSSENQSSDLILLDRFGRDVKFWDHAPQMNRRFSEELPFWKKNDRDDLELEDPVSAQEEKKDLELFEQMMKKKTRNHQIN